MEVESHRLPRLDQKPGIFGVEVEGRTRPTKLRNAGVTVVRDVAAVEAGPALGGHDPARLIEPL